MASKGVPLTRSGISPSTTNRVCETLKENLKSQHWSLVAEHTIGPWIGKSHGRKAGDGGYANTENTQCVLLLHGNPGENPWVRVKTEGNQSRVAVGVDGRLFGQAKEMDEDF